MVGFRACLLRDLAWAGVAIALAREIWFVNFVRCMFVEIQIVFCFTHDVSNISQ